MKVLALIEAAGHVCYRYRIEPFAPAMAERGMLLESAPLQTGAAARLRQFRACRRADVVILQRKLLPVWQLTLLRRSARRLIYDVDDAVFQRDSYSRKGAESTVRMARFWATAYAADAVIAGNGHLKRRIAELVGPEKVRMAPTCIEPSRYRPAEHQRRGPKARLVWIGQSSTLSSLHLAGSHLSAAAQRVAGLQLRVVCDRSIDLPPLHVVSRAWSTAGEAAELADADIGVNWLPDDAWSRGKCTLRVLQYMAAGLPVVANPVGMNRRLVRHGRTGLLAATPGEWAEAIARLANDPELRRRLGAAGRRLIERRYSPSAWERTFCDVVAGAGEPRVPLLARKQCSAVKKGTACEQAVAHELRYCDVPESGRAI